MNDYKVSRACRTNISYPERRKRELTDDGSFLAVDQSETQEHNLGRNGMPYNVMQRFMDARASGDYLTASQYDALIKQQSPDFDIPADVDPSDYAARIMPRGYQSPAEISRFSEYIAKLQQDKQLAAARRQELDRELSRRAAYKKSWDAYFDSLNKETKQTNSNE